MNLSFLFLLIALILFIVDGLGVSSRLRLQSIGLASLVLAMLVGGAYLNV